MNSTNRVHKKHKPWKNRFNSLTERVLGQTKSEAAWQTHKELFTPDYQALISPRYALNDLLQIERLIASNCESISLVKPFLGHQDYRLHFYSLRERYLDEFIPVLENMNLRIMDQVQFTYKVNGVTATIKSFTVKAAKTPCAPLRLLKSTLLECVHAVMAYRVENDALNKLCILTGMGWQEIDVLRTYRNYFLQLGHSATHASIQRAFVNNPEAALGLFNYFEARFRPDTSWIDPVAREEQALFPIRMQLLAVIDQVSDINDDRILRTMFNLIDATVRSNFHNRKSSVDFFIAIKVNSLGVIDMPSPRPLYEIYVHASDMEGIHLRGGKVSRGGIRWSDRQDDFRTEILGLMQTQINKNALIIPTGSKGGFIVKQNHADLDSKAAGKNAYLRLIRGLLDLTDNYSNGSIIHPEGVVAHDDPDPYLVVAADKGTARFSDIANAVSAEYRFWLDDAFASGGSHGYDHKALGITAKGAWECVKHHFRELGKDIQQDAFTVIGIGSMDGDVFGNGMLLSQGIRLQAAFSGLHIFIDPTPPDNDQPFNERKRLFELPGSTWDDYDRNLISKGGGVYARSAKDIPVTPEVKKWLGIRYKSIDGDTLIRYLLTAPVELLWLGGIGTYVKASTEKHEDVGDRGNDSIRVDALALGATVVGEGANLGFTQKARIEYSLKGGRINTDAVDNSAGVDTSDHEVNLKILLSGLHKQGLIPDYQTLFMDMTDAVCRLVLSDNIAQSLCLSLEQQRCSVNSEAFIAIADRLEAAGYLDRTVDAFPQAADIQNRHGQQITRPEFAELMAASKRFLTQQMLDQPIPWDAEYYQALLTLYFPPQLGTQFKKHLPKHPLAKEIKATVISNKIINQAGCGFLSLLAKNGNGTIMDAVNCYLAYNHILQADVLRSEINAFDNALTPDRQYALLLLIEKSLIECCRWSLMNNTAIRPEKSTLNDYSHYLATFVDYLSQHPTPQWQEQISHYQQAQIPAGLAQKIAILGSIKSFPFLILMSTETKQNFTTILALLNDVQLTLNLNEISQQLEKIPLSDHWQRNTFDDLQADIQSYTGKLIKNIIASPMDSCTGYFEPPHKKEQLNHYRQIYTEIQNTSPYTLLPYVSLVRALGKLVAGN